MEKLLEILDPHFVLRNSVYASILIGAVVPLAGIHLVLSRRAILALALPEAGGMGVAFTAWLSVFLGSHITHDHPGAVPFFFWGLGGAFVAMALTLGLLLLLERRAAAPQNSETGAVFALAFGLTLALAASNLITELGILDLLKGEILAISNGLLVCLSIGFAAVAAVLFLLRHPLQMVLYDRRMAYATGLPARGLNALAMALVCVTIALGGLCAGPLAIFAFLVLPPVTVLPFVRRMRELYLLAPLLGITCGFGGFYASYVLEDWNLPTSAAQIVVLGLVWLFSRVVVLARPQLRTA
ncbi:MAG: metal ABC transporter permease [Planctomycetes bacterium]|nr:metal ABC transporter permease [Planctomycetota bacterium]